MNQTEDILARIDALLKLEKEATPGPWKHLGYGFGTTVEPGNIGFCHGFQDDCDDTESGEQNAALIASLRNIAKPLLEALRLAIEELHRIEDNSGDTWEGEGAQKALAAISDKLTKPTP